ncbi:MAG: D-tyrosyl-tRNA(Tyr) deacylase [Prevotellaceae bacterium]|jgi:D-tyrosyl-tRNA(Tyr) deacylase|nr:D-tyrosyl-tRNA(Tyr) deacylase [Prevotellaceae bacterium]
MRVLIQRVTKASVSISGTVKSAIGNGLLVLTGFEYNETNEDIKWIAAKITKLRIFDDEQGIMNLSIKDINGEILAISQFTLHALTKKGNRPSYIKAAKPETAVSLYDSFVDALSHELGKSIATGEFGADMQVELINNGPVTIWIDSKNRE